MKGYIEVHLPKEAEDLSLRYVKVAELQEAEEVYLPEKDVEYAHGVTVEEGNIGRITDLEKGVYQIQAFTDSGYEFMPSVVSVPLWDEEEKEMQYEITVIPKYTVLPQAPDTGDGSKGMLYGLFGMISLIIVVIISCHNRLKCGRMSHMYSKRRRT